VGCDVSDTESAIVITVPGPVQEEQVSTVPVVLEVLEGCAPAAEREAAARGTARLVSPTELVLETEDLGAVRSLRCVVAAYRRLRFPARRPRELLETSVQQRIAETVAELRRQRPRERFTGVRLRAAGADSTDMQRLEAEIAEHAGLPVDPEGDLVVRVRRATGEGPAAWEVLIRLTARPLATRPWRTGRYPGAVNATIAASVLEALDVRAEDSLLDMTFGTGTFLIEQLHRVAPQRAVGVDLDADALAIAELHQRQARCKGRIKWLQGDVRDEPLAGRFTRFVTNPPWGTLLGEHEENEDLLTDLLARARELATPDARLAVLTHEIARMERVLEKRAAGWTPDGPPTRYFQKGHHPRLWILERR
jgi:predicted RNA methylase